MCYQKYTEFSWVLNLANLSSEHNIIGLFYKFGNDRQPIATHNAIVQCLAILIWWISANSPIHQIYPLHCIKKLIHN